LSDQLGGEAERSLAAMTPKRVPGPTKDEDHSEPARAKCGTSEFKPERGAGPWTEPERPAGMPTRAKEPAARAATRKAMDRKCTTGSLGACKRLARDWNLHAIAAVVSKRAPNV
jgi:hypothetical protein